MSIFVLLYFVVIAFTTIFFLYRNVKLTWTDALFVLMLSFLAPMLLFRQVALFPIETFVSFSVYLVSAIISLVVDMEKSLKASLEKPIEWPYSFMPQIPLGSSVLSDESPVLSENTPVLNTEKPEASTHK